MTVEREVAEDDLEESHSEAKACASGNENAGQLEAVARYSIVYATDYKKRGTIFRHFQI